jgi:hypothetical protein
MKSVLLPVWVCKNFHAMRTLPVSVTAVPLLDALVERSSTLVWAGQKSVKWRLPEKSLASSKPAGKQ